MIDFPFFRTLGSLALAEGGAELKAVLLNERGGILRKPARALVNQANKEAQAKGIPYLFAALSDRPFDDEIALDFSTDFQLKGVVACKQDDSGSWVPDDAKLIMRRGIGACLGVFVGPIENQSVVACFKEFIDEGFPSETVTTPDLKLVAGAALRLIVPNLRATPLTSESLLEIENVTRLSDVLETLKIAYLSIGNKATAWNVMWMLHADAGLTALGKAVTSYEGNDLDGFIFDVLYPCFALPNPDGVAATYRKGHVLSKAISESWGSSDDVAVSIERIGLRRSSEGLTKLLLSGLDWSDFDTTVNRKLDGGKGNQLLGWILHAQLDSIFWTSFLDITEEEFFSPTPGTPQVFEFLDADEQSLHTHGIISKIEVLGPSTLVRNASGRYLAAQPLIVLLPIGGSAPSLAMVQASSIVLRDLNPRGKGHLDVEITKRDLWRDGRVALHINITTSVTKSGNFQFTPKIRNLKIQMPAGDSLNQMVLRDAQARVLMLPPDGIGALITGVNKSKQLMVVGEQAFDQNGIVIEDGEDISLEVEPDTDIKVFVWSVTEPTLIQMNDRDQVIDKACAIRWQKMVQMPTASIRIQIDDKEILIEPIENDSRDSDSTHTSPLRAATEKVKISQIVGKAESEDLRARVETLISENWRGWRTVGLNLGHIAVSSECGEDLSSVQLHSETRVLVSAEISNFGPNKMWPAAEGDKIEDELLESTELNEFIKAFEALKLLDAIDANVENGGPSWVSKIEIPIHLRSAVEDPENWRSLLDSYLDAYVSLVHKADQVCNSGFGKFWARFPFSLSIWNKTPRTLAAVMLSPFHPLRLAWIANAEDALRTSSAAVDIRRMYAGTISGWQFPMVTRSNREHGFLVAVPTDGGSDSLFAGWSMLVRVSADALTPLSIPKSAADSDVPGVSANGLDSSALESAIDDFCKANPFVSTIVVDLAATSPSPRTNQLDMGLISKLRNWVEARTSAGHSSGGIRIYDSTNRLGEIPQEASEILETPSGNKTSLTWRKYDPQSLSPQANIRVMNDSGVNVEVHSSNKRYGVVSRYPLRRFEVTHVVEGQATSESNPLVVPRKESSFVGALVAAESIDASNIDLASKIHLSLHAGHALLAGADWTVVGESGLAPASLTALLQHTENGYSRSTLWEWRPPFFDSGHDSVLSTVDRRPYLTVAQIPKIYSQKLRGLVTHLLPASASEKEITKKIDRVLETLGSRGVGLSSLINGNQKYRTHQKGALGFSMVFDLIDKANTEDTVRFLIPIDAANQYLNILAGRRRREGGPRADLLAMELRDHQLVLVPIEIKFYSLESPVAMLPGLTDAGVLDAVNQARSSADLLNEVVASWKDTRSEIGTRELMDNALTALVDAAIRLTPLNKDSLASVHRRLQALVDGDLDIVVGAPVVSYLVATRDGLKSRRTSMATPFHAEVLVADPRQIEIDLSSGFETKALREWRQVLDFAFNSAVPNIDAGYEDSDTSSIIDQNEMPLPDSADDHIGSVDEEVLQLVGSEEERNSESEIDLSMNEQNGTRPLNTDAIAIKIELKQEPVMPFPSSTTSSSDVVVPPGVKIPIGDALDGESQSMWMWPGNTNLNSLNIGVLGDMGTGKTQLCLGLVNQFRRSSRTTQPNTMTGLIIDYKHDYQKPEFLSSVGGTVLKPRNLPLDLFGIAGEKSMFAMNNKAMNFISIISMVFGGIGGQQRDRLRQVIIDKIDELPHSPTMRDISEAYRIAVNNRSDSVTEILNNFVYGEVFTSNHEEFKTIEELLDDKVVVVDLRALDPDERTKRTLVAVFLSKYFEYMIGLPKWPVQQGSPQIRRLNSFLLVDEAVSIMEYDFDPLHKILLQGREYGVAVVLSSQYLSHFMTSDLNYAQPLRTWFIHRVPTVSKKSLNDLGITSATNEDATRIADLGIHHSFYSSFDCHGAFIAGYPFYKQLEDLPSEEQNW